VDKAVAAGPDYSPVVISKVASTSISPRLLAQQHDRRVPELSRRSSKRRTPKRRARRWRGCSRAVREQPIRYAAITHHHTDHIGGVAALPPGRTLLVERGHERPSGALRRAAHESPGRTRDEAEGAAESRRLENLRGEEGHCDGGQTPSSMRSAAIPTSIQGHRLRTQRTRAVQSDLFVPGVGAPAGPDACTCCSSVRKLNLRIETNVGGHGGVAPFDELVKAVALAGR